MITAAQAAQFLDQAAGVTLPPFLIAAAIETVEAAEPAMQAAGYTEATTVRVQCMAVALIAGADSARRISSQGAASGASRSFKYADNALSQMRRTLAALDTANTVGALVGPDPAAATLFMVV